MTLATGRVPPGSLRGWGDGRCGVRSQLLVAMARDLSSEETTIFAIYSTRRNARMAQEYLQGENIETFIRADDAGGMHPQLQRPHGVKLVGMSRAAQDAYEALKEADLLPAPMEDADDERGREASPLDTTEETKSPTMSAGAAGGIAIVTVILAVLYYLFLA